MTITKFGLSRRAPGLGAIALALTVPLAAGQTRTQTSQTPPGTLQGKQTPQTQAAQPSGSPRQGPGQRPPGSPYGEWWKDELVKKQIGLSDEKARRMDQFYQDRTKRLAPLVDELNKQEDELDRLTRERTVDEVTYSLQAGRFWDLRRRLGESRTIMLYRMYQELTLEQHKKLNALRDEWRAKGRGGGSR